MFIYAINGIRVDHDTGRLTHVRWWMRKSSRGWPIRRSHLHLMSWKGIVRLLGGPGKMAR
jgi:hypothetical protein